MVSEMGGDRTPEDEELEYQRRLKTNERLKLAFVLFATLFAIEEVLFSFKTHIKIEILVFIVSVYTNILFIYPSSQSIVLHEKFDVFRHSY